PTMITTPFKLSPTSLPRVKVNKTSSLFFNGNNVKPFEAGGWKKATPPPPGRFPAGGARGGACTAPEFCLGRRSGYVKNNPWVRFGSKMA
ncbi:MAG: hypothetical protein MUF67_12000, partial [Desulfobacterales bacterium]|nr:hypothetical protein [Desulfobacterales bacterium]